MELSINGEPQEIDLPHRTVASLIASLALPRSRVAVELNGDLVRHTNRENTFLQDGDRVEIVTLVGGG